MAKLLGASWSSAQAQLGTGKHKQMGRFRVLNQRQSLQAAINLLEEYVLPLLWKLHVESLFFTMREKLLQIKAEHRALLNLLIIHWSLSQNMT